MQPASIIEGLSDPAPGFIGENLRQRDDARRYRVPLQNLRLSSTCGQRLEVPAGTEALLGLAQFPGVSQFYELFSDAKGFALLASSDLVKATGCTEAATQELAGSIVVFPPGEWQAEKEAMADWMADDIERVFEDLPYAFDDIMPFAGVNYSPDRWYVIVRGAMAGSICWWTHDGDSVMEESWATGLRSWAARVWAELPDVLGGIIRFCASDSIDPCPEDAELYPVHFLRDIRVK